MAKPKDDKILFTEHVLEIRHAAVGLFLDVRGYVADYIRQEGFFPHWKIAWGIAAILMASEAETELEEQF